MESVRRREVSVLRRNYLFFFLATIVALHFTPVSEWVSGFRTSVASRLASLFVSQTVFMFVSQLWRPCENLKKLHAGAFKTSFDAP